MTILLWQIGGTAVAALVVIAIRPRRAKPVYVPPTVNASMPTVAELAEPCPSAPAWTAAP